VTDENQNIEEEMEKEIRFEIDRKETGVFDRSFYTSTPTQFNSRGWKKYWRT